MPKLANFQSEFYCTKCGNPQKFSIPRPNGQARPAGHLKKMYCFHCEQEVNFCEVKRYTKYDYFNFLEEFEGCNFDENGNRILPYGLFKDKLVKNQTYYPLVDFIKKKYEKELEDRIWK